MWPCHGRNRVGIPAGARPLGGHQVMGGGSRALGDNGPLQQHNVEGTTLVRALLFTDVIDSTRLSARLGDAAMANLWAAHDRVARDLLRDWRGREIDKSDGMLLL